MTSAVNWGCLLTNKISRPVTEQLVRRERLFARLDECLSSPLIWIHAPAGSGKTSIVSSYIDARKLPCIWYQFDEGDADPSTFFYYLGLAANEAIPHLPERLPLLTPEYKSGIAVFSRRFFEKLFLQLTAPYTLVFDNFQAVSNANHFPEILRTCLLEVPPGVSIVVISREGPFSELISFKLARLMRQVGWEDLKLTEDEAAEVAAAVLGQAIDAPVVQALHEKSRGWMAGIILMLLSGREGRFNLRGSSDQTPKEIFDYFAVETFARFEPQVQEFLLATSIIPSVTLQVAQKLDGFSDAAEILAFLEEKNCFIERLNRPDPAWQYHPLFQEFLHNRARRRFKPERINELQRRAAYLLREEGRQEDAADLLVKARDWENLADLVKASAQQLVEQGRSRTLDSWLTALPDDVLRRDPWLLYWKGSCLMTEGAREAIPTYEAAYALFMEGDNPSGSWLAWSAIVDTHFYEISHWKPLELWIERFEATRLRFPAFQSEAIELKATSSMFMAHVLCQTDEEAVLRWHGRVADLLRRNFDPAVRVHTGFCLAIYNMWTGNYARNTALIAELREELTGRPASTSNLLTVKMLEAMHFWLTADHVRSLKAVDEGDAITRHTGVHLWDNLFLSCRAEAAMVGGDSALLEEVLARMAGNLPRATSVDRIYYYLLSAWQKLVAGEAYEALVLLGGAAEPVQRLASHFHEGIWNVGMAAVLQRLGRGDEARLHLDTARRIGEKMRSLILLFIVFLTEAEFAFQAHDEAAGLEVLRRALAIGRAQGYLHFIWWQPAVIAELCRHALDAGIEVDYVRTLVRKRGLVPVLPPLELEQWPWQLHIRTLGSFRVEVNGQLLAFSGKVQKKPLELLKILIALGGSEVEEQTVCDALWPDMEGDKAHGSFTSALFRLRQLLGQEGLIQLCEGRLSFDRRHTWIDAWAFERVSQQAREWWTDPARRTEAAALTQRVVSLYGGEFLPADRDKPWSHPMREQLKARFLEMVPLLCDHWHASGDRNRAIYCYHDALRIDPTSEALYQQLMACYLEAGQKADVCATFERCKKTLALELGTKPSPKTFELYRCGSE